MISRILAIMIGGSLGASGRYLAFTGAQRLIPFSFPAGTLAVNIVGIPCAAGGFTLAKRLIG